MYESKATLNYPFGDITIKVGVDGKVDRPQQMVTHMLSTAVAVTGIEAIQLGISDSSRDEKSGRLQQKCAVPSEFGDIKVITEINFDLKQHTPNRKLNDLVYGSVLPKIWQTAAVYVGDHQPLTTPQAPLPSIPRRDVLDSIDDALGLSSPLVSEQFGQQQSGEQRQRQIATR